MLKAIYFYGFDSLKRVQDCKFLFQDRFSVNDARCLADDMARKAPDIQEIYMIDNYYNLRLEYINACKAQARNLHMEWHEFYDSIVRAGIQVPFIRSMKPKDEA